MSELNDIMIKYGTDKMIEDNNYMSVYEEILEPIKNNKLKILEIGIWRAPLEAQQREEGKGRRLPAASLMTWYEYLPNTEIYGIDLEDFKDINNDRIETSICNQESVEDLTNLIERIGGDFDVIIDDGGHTMKQHQVSLSVLFKHLKSGGAYIIEDLGTCYSSSYVKNDKTTLVMLDEFTNTNKITSKYINEEDSEYISNNISNVVTHTTREDGYIPSIISVLHKK
jgi:hypothetical protein